MRIIGISAKYTRAFYEKMKLDVLSASLLFDTPNIESKQKINT